MGRGGWGEYPHVCGETLCSNVHDFLPYHPPSRFKNDPLLAHVCLGGYLFGTRALSPRNFGPTSPPNYIGSRGAGRPRFPSCGWVGGGFSSNSSALYPTPFPPKNHDGIPMTKRWPLPVERGGGGGWPWYHGREKS